MLLRTLLNIMNPYKAGAMRKRMNILQRIRVWMFVGGVRFMSVFYKRYAYADIVDLVDVVVSQSRRDMEFERWLSHIKIDVRPHLRSASELPASGKLHWYRPFYKFFHMEQLMTVYHANRKITIDRTYWLSLATNTRGRLKLSTQEDIIQRCEFKVGGLTLPRLNVEEPKVPKKTKKGRVSLGETKPINIQIDEPQPAPPAPVTRQIKGAEVDESF